MRLSRFSITALLLISICFSGTLHAAPPSRTIGFQGYLKDGTGKPVTTATNLTFRLYSSTRTESGSIWSETHANVLFTNGVYGVLLGSTANLDSLSFDIPYFLGVSVGGGSELTPRQPLTSSPYAFRAAMADSMSTSSRIISTVSTGTPPLQVGSTTLVPNLNAEMVGGKYAGDFVLKGGDGMTGALGLPLNGLVVGGNQLVTAGGKVGVGTATPQNSLHVVDATTSNDVPAIYGEHAVTDFYGVGVKGKGGWKGVVGTVEGTGVSNYVGVSGTASTTGATGVVYGGHFAATGGDGTTAYGGYFSAAGGSGTSFGIYADAPKSYFSGNVGIGTTTPTAKLEVAGALKVSGAGNGVVFPDGTIQTTAAAPSWSQVLSAAQRFQLVMNDEAVLDRETGLVWARTPLPTAIAWSSGASACVNATIGGRKGWRMPTIYELSTLVDTTQSSPALPSGHPFLNIITNLYSRYWSSTVTGLNDVTVWSLEMTFGTVHSEMNNYTYDYVWPVRGPQ
jgi:Protein of unknown function (DUF1566)